MITPLTFRSRSRTLLPHQQADTKVVLVEKTIFIKETNMDEIDVAKRIKEIRVYYHNEEIVRIDDPQTLNQLQCVMSCVTKKEQMDINNLLNEMDKEESGSSGKGVSNDGMNVMNEEEIELKIIGVLANIFSAARSSINQSSIKETVTVGQPCEEDEEDAPF
jgi:hypothetical protein